MKIFFYTCWGNPLYRQLYAPRFVRAVCFLSLNRSPSNFAVLTFLFLKNYKFKDCVVPSLKNNRRYFIHCCLHYIQWRNTLRKVHKLAGTWAQTVDIFRCAMLLKRTISTFATKEKKWFTLNPIKITNFRLLW